MFNKIEFQKEFDRIEAEYLAVTARIDKAIEDSKVANDEVLEETPMQKHYRLMREKELEERKPKAEVQSTEAKTSKIPSVDVEEETPMQRYYRLMKEADDAKRARK